jgi:hypothetical protein
MPNLRLSDEETSAIIKFLKNQNAAPPVHAPDDKSGAAKMEHGANHQ